MARNVKIKKNEENPETPEILANSILRIAKAFEILMAGPLTQKAYISLLHGMPGMQQVSKTQIKLVLENLKKLKSYYIR